MTAMQIDRAVVEQALEALLNSRPLATEDDCVDKVREHNKAITALRAALAQQDEPDHETRAELAEQQVVQLAEERDHYRNLWQKAQQAEPVAWLQPKTVDGHLRPDLGYETCSKDDYGAFPVNTAPPQRKPLTEEEIDKIFKHLCNTVGASCKTMARAVERAHGIKE